MRLIHKAGINDTIKPKFGAIHTITWVGIGSSGKSMLELEGFYQRYSIRRFRPLITRTQSEDVAQFLFLLDSIDA